MPLIISGYGVSILFGYLVGTKLSIRAGVLSPMVYHFFTTYNIIAKYGKWNILNRELISYPSSYGFHFLVGLFLFYLFVFAHNRDKKENIDRKSYAEDSDENQKKVE